MTGGEGSSPLSGVEYNVLIESIAACRDLAQLEQFERSMQRIFQTDLQIRELRALFAARRQELRTPVRQAGAEAGKSELR